MNSRCDLDEPARDLGRSQAALRIYTEAASPQEWAAAQGNLGCAYAQLPTGDRAENLRQAIACHQAALRIYTEAAFPQQWAAAQGNLGNDYLLLPTGDRTENLRQAIACHQAALRVYTEAAFPQQWAAAQSNLGKAYFYLPTGDRAESLHHAIACYEAALRIYTEAALPEDWAAAQVNLGNVYSGLPTGARAENRRRAIGCCQAALRVYTEAAFPREWAATQVNLGIVYTSLRTGDRAGNLRKAIDHYQAALRVHSEAALPEQWAWTQGSLASAYSSLPTGDRAENLRQAIACYKMALQIYTAAAFPEQWARLQGNLGNAHAQLPTGDRTENLRRAIACHQAALRIYTEAGFPQGWASTQSNLGAALRTLFDVSRETACLESARNAFAAAARGYTAVGLKEAATAAAAEVARADAALARATDPFDFDELAYDLFVRGVSRGGAPVRFSQREGLPLMMQATYDGTGEKLYPDLAARGGLVPALGAALAEIGSSLAVSPRTHRGPVLVYARVEAESRFSQVHIAENERLFLFDFWNRGVMLAEGQTPDLREMARAIDRWVASDCTSGDLASEFGCVQVYQVVPFSEHGEEQKEVERRWRHYSGVLISLEIEEQPSLFLVLTADGLVKRMGTGAIDNTDRHMFIGKTQEPLFHGFMESVPDEILAEILAHPGMYTCPGEHRGKACKLTLVFRTSGGQDVGIGFLYGAESIGPPPAIRDLVIHAMELTEPWLQRIIPHGADGR